MKKYPSKISCGLLFFILVVLMGASLPMFYKPVWPVILIMSVVLLFIGHLYLNTCYMIEGTKLIVKCGFLVLKKIDINSVKSIKETNTIISAPALSFDRIEVKWGDYTSVVISPKDKKGFIEHMKSINPQIHIELKRQ